MLLNKDDCIKWCNKALELAKSDCEYFDCNYCLGSCYYCNVYLKSYNFL